MGCVLTQLLVLQGILWTVALGAPSIQMCPLQKISWVGLLLCELALAGAPKHRPWGTNSWLLTTSILRTAEWHFMSLQYHMTPVRPGNAVSSDSISTSSLSSGCTENKIILKSYSYSSIQYRVKIFEVHSIFKNLFCGQAYLRMSMSIEWELE